MSEKNPELPRGELTEAEARAKIVPADLATGNETGTDWTFGEMFDLLKACGEIRAGVTVAQFVEAFLAGRHSDY